MFVRASPTATEEGRGVGQEEDGRSPWDEHKNRTLTPIPAIPLLKEFANRHDYGR